MNWHRNEEEEEGEEEDAQVRGERDMSDADLFSALLEQTLLGNRKRAAQTCNRKCIWDGL